MCPALQNRDYARPSSIVNNFLQRRTTLQDSAPVGCRQMARPVVHGPFGAYLRAMREAKGLGLRQTVALAAARFPDLTKGALEGIERGETRHIAAELFRAMSTLYDHPYADLVARYVASEYGLQMTTSDLTRHAGTKSSAPTLPEAFDRESAATRIRELESRVRTLETYERILAKVRPHIIDVLALIGRKGRPLVRKQSRGSGSA